MNDKKKVYCTNDLVDGLTKDKIYEVEYISCDYYNLKNIYYDVVDDYGVVNTYKADRFIDIKQVVINGGESYGDLLTPYLIVELFKRKGKTLYGYDWNTKSDDTHYELIDVKDYNNFKDINHILYSCKKIEGKIYESEALIDSYDIFDDLSREDKDLIDIAKEINDESIIKIVDIPANVDYYIQSGECSFAETVVEKHRRWS